MGRVAFNIAAAAEASGVTKHLIQDAIRTGALHAKRIQDQPIILTGALAAWVESHPDWLTDAG